MLRLVVAQTMIVIQVESSPSATSSVVFTIRPFNLQGGLRLQCRCSMALLDSAMIVGAYGDHI